MRERREAERGGLKEQDMGGREVWEEEQDGRKGEMGGFEDEEDGGVEGYLRERRKAERGG